MGGARRQLSVLPLVSVGRTGSEFLSDLLETHVKHVATDSLPCLCLFVMGFSLRFKKLSFNAVLFIASIVFLLGASSQWAYLYDVVDVPSKEVIGLCTIS